jgi:hypothetical protein
LTDNLRLNRFAFRGFQAKHRKVSRRRHNDFDGALEQVIGQNKGEKQFPPKYAGQRGYENKYKTAKKLSDERVSYGSDRLTTYG